ncbi:MAG TPA: glycosyltransferase family 39 protein, partial [Thermoanaerobaculia bacterium]|nr:glycosyltransferase family 39 protein [Thermoanaerobaculia bacterium]
MPPAGPLASFERPRNPEGAAFWTRVALFAGLGLVLRLFVIASIPTQPVSDFWEYFQRAESIVRPGPPQQIPGVTDAGHPPAYPLALAAFMLFVTPHLLAAKLANCALAVSTIAIGAGLARDLGGRRCGIAAAILFSFYPRLLLMPLLLASENLFSPLLLLFVWAAVKRWRTGASLRLAAVAGILIGLAALTRSIGYFLPLVWLAGTVAARARLRTILAELMLMLAVEHGVMFPWAIHNTRTTGRFTFLSSLGGIGLYIGNNPRATGDWYDWTSDLERAR